MKPVAQETSAPMNMPLAVIVEDDRDIVDLFCQLLEIVGYRTESVLDGADALRLISEAPPDLVLLDLQLPGMSGVEILNRMRESETLAHVPVVVITAFSQLPQTLLVEPDLLLQKPVDINRLTRLVQTIKDAKQGTSQPPLDSITGLSRLSFFLVRLALSLERIKQNLLKRSAVLFADVIQWEDLRSGLSGGDLDELQHQLADQFKHTLRPTDAMTWWAENGYFLTLIENVSSQNIPVRMAKRVADEMRKYSGPYNSGMSLRVNLGVLMYDGDYVDVDEILRDLLRAGRQLRMRTKPASMPAVFDKEMLYGRR